MPREPKNEIMSPTNMKMMAEETRVGNRLYSRTSDGAEVVNALVSQLAIDLANMPRKINLRDTEQLRSVAVAYVDACSHTGTLPSKIGFCHACGISRQGVDAFMKSHPNEESVETLRIIFESFADTLNSASLANACHPIVGIFTLKSQAGWRDTVSIEAEPPEDPLGARKNTNEIIARYADILPDDA